MTKKQKENSFWSRDYIGEMERLFKSSRKASPVRSSSKLSRKSISSRKVASYRFRSSAGSVTGITAGSQSSYSGKGIWYFQVSRDPASVLDLVLQSNVVTHVLFYISNRWTGGVLEDEECVSLLRYGISAVKSAGKKSILAGNFWPTNDSEGHTSAILFDSDYYLAEVAYIVAKRAEYGADYSGLDMESYGGSGSPIYSYMSYTEDYHPSDEETASVAACVASAGLVDFVLPAGALRSYSFSNPLSAIGINQIVESSYYDKTVDISAQISDCEASHVWYGIYLNTEKGSGPNFYYVPSEISEDRSKWADYAGVFLYPLESNVSAVAELMTNIQL